MERKSEEIVFLIYLGFGPEDLAQKWENWARPLSQGYANSLAKYSSQKKKKSLAKYR
jgi:hypothetical protein